LAQQEEQQQRSLELAREMQTQQEPLSQNRDVMENNPPIDPNTDPLNLDRYNADWFSLPLDNLFDNSTGTVDPVFGTLEPEVGDRDMLELITS
jgi:hypothetical protein